MVRHKAWFLYDGEWDIFDKLKYGGMVNLEYDYSNKKMSIGTVCHAKENGVEFISIVTNMSNIRTSGHGRRYKRSERRVMYALNDEGCEFIRGKHMAMIL